MGAATADQVKVDVRVGKPGQEEPIDGSPFTLQGDPQRGFFQDGYHFGRPMHKDERCRLSRRDVSKGHPISEVYANPADWVLQIRPTLAPFPAQGFSCIFPGGTPVNVPAEQWTEPPPMQPAQLWKTHLQWRLYTNDDFYRKPGVNVIIRVTGDTGKPQTPQMRKRYGYLQRRKTSTVKR